MTVIVEAPANTAAPEPTATPAPPAAEGTDLPLVDRPVTTDAELLEADPQSPPPVDVPIAPNDPPTRAPGKPAPADNSSGGELSGVSVSALFAELEKEAAALREREEARLRERLEGLVSKLIPIHKMEFDQDGERIETRAETKAGHEALSPLPRVIVSVELAGARALHDAERQRTSRDMAGLCKSMIEDAISYYDWVKESQRRTAAGDY